MYFACYLILIFCSKLILRGHVALLVMAVLPKDLSYQAAVQILLVNRVKAALADCSWAVADYLLLRGLNQVLSPNHHHLIIGLLGQEVVVMIHSGALNSFHLAQEKGNEELTLWSSRLLESSKGHGSVLILFLWKMSTLVDYSVYFPSNVGSIQGISSWSFGRLLLYLFWCSSMNISAWTHSRRDNMFL